MIPVKTYTKRQLARMYWPETPTDRSAVERLRCDIRRCKALTSALRQLPGYQPSANHYSALEVKLIIEYLGEPYYASDDIR